MRLEKWGVYGDMSVEPEYRRAFLVGQVYDHPNPRHHDGKEIQTSNIVGVVGDSVQTASGSLYELGAVDPEYGAAFPAARQRLFASWPDLSKS